MALHGWPDVFHIRVVAPLEMRIAHLQQKENISPESARARLEASAKTRARYLRRSYSVEIDDPTLYHLTVNTGLLGLSQAISLVLQTSQAWFEADCINQRDGLSSGIERA
jgi:cytidylate kinase